jgi:hypothetical protein
LIDIDSGADLSERERRPRANPWHFRLARRSLDT